MTLIYRIKDTQRYKHVRNSKKQAKKTKPIVIRDYEAMRVNELAREKALQAYNESKVNHIWGNIMIDTAQAEATQKVNIWRATFERAYDLMNNKINGLVNQIKESDKRAQDLNMGFYNKIDTVNNRFYADLAAMTQESQKRNVGFMKKSQVQKFMNDFNNLTRENEKRNAGFQGRKKKKDKEDKFKKLCEESQNRNNIYTNRRKITEMDRLNKMNECRANTFMARRPDSKYDAVMALNEKRAAGFSTKKPLTKLEEITKWNCQRNALFNLRE